MTVSRACPPLPAPRKRGEPPDFNRLARLYRWMELFSFGPWLARCRFTFLGDLAGCRRALVLGDGDGRFTAQLTKANSMVAVDAVDASPAMLRELLRRSGDGAQRIRTHCADARVWRPTCPPYDVIATHFFLDCLTDEEARAIAGKLRSGLSPSGLWVVSEFAIPAGTFGRWVAQPVVRLLYRAFGLLTGLAVRKLPDHAAALRAAGFTLRDRREFLGGMLTAEMWQTRERSISADR